MEQEFIENQERLKPQEEKQDEERNKVDEMRGTPLRFFYFLEILNCSEEYIFLNCLFKLVWEILKNSSMKTTQSLPQVMDPSIMLEFSQL